MNNRKYATLALLLVLTMLASFLVSAVSASPDHTVKEKVFTTYLVDPIGVPGTDSYNMFDYSGIHWSSGVTITYYVNLKGAPTGALGAIKNSFEIWDMATGVELFSDTVLASSKLVGSKYDGKNAVSWGRLKPGIIAQTTTWYYPSTGEIVEVGIVFNSLYRWSIESTANSFDVQNIATHEAGHTLMLLDLYTAEANQLTMYGYGSYGETYARTLGAGDVSGIQYIYGS